MLSSDLTTYLTASPDAFHLHAGYAFTVHFRDGETQVFINKTFATAGNETELIENEATHGGVGGIFRNFDVVLRFQISNVQGGVKNYRTIGESQGFFDDVEFIVNFTDHLFKNIFQLYQP